MSPHDELVADFRGTGVTTGAHPMTLVRRRLDTLGVVTAAALGRIPNGRRGRVAGMVVVRQRPGTAKGFVFITVEDETGFANAILTPQCFATHRASVLNLGAMIIEGTVQNQDGVVSIKADRFAAIPGSTPARPDDIENIDISHDFH
jgi:error-prone DNA polymerase